MNKDDRYRFFELLLDLSNKINGKPYQAEPDKRLIDKTAETIYSDISCKNAKKFKYPLIFICAYYANAVNLSQANVQLLIEGTVKAGNLDQEDGLIFGRWLAENINKNKFAKLEQKLKRLIEFLPPGNRVFLFWDQARQSFSAETISAKTKEP